jgi:copper(I)-binding protein
MIKDPWIREVPPVSRNTAAFMTIINRGSAPDTLIEIKSSASEKAEIHMMVHEGGVMKMRRIRELTIGPNEEVRLKPGGIHIMLISLKKPLQAGRKVKIILIFRKTGKMTIEALVRKM